MNSPDEVPHTESAKVTLMLADYAVVTQDKLTVVGAGWTHTSAQTAPIGIGAIIEVPWNQTNQNHKFRLALMDIDGNPVEVDTPEGTQAVHFEGEFQVGRPPGVRLGAAIPVPFAINHGPIALEPGSHYVWQFSLNGVEDQDWRLPFSTRTEAQAQAA
jgi:hypothetical protein